MITKIQKHHTEKLAYVYIRQSTMGQVRYNQESTERQYALKEKAIEFGWENNKIKILDQDLGISGAQIAGREDFKILVADVSMNKVGAVFALEASRLSRSSADWHRLLELCSITETLIIDEDGCYDLSDFNDQLLLGLKGTMSQAELHFIRSRLQGGKLNKAKKGELRSPLPVGFVYDEEDSIVFDPDKEVFGAVQLIFHTFHELGTAYAVVQKFANLDFKFPRRQYGGIWNGKLIWGSLSHSRILSILKNPCYAGVYVYGRYRYEKSISANGDIQTKVKELPMSSWFVTIKNHHQGYITYEDFFSNKEKLEANRTNGEENLLSGAAREGLALLQGLLLCSKCGRKITIRYKGSNGIYPSYECVWLKRDGLSGTYCFSLHCNLLDEAVSARVLEVLKPEQINIALKALKEIESRNEAVSKQWEMKIERAEYEAQLAQKRYEKVDPFNRLVASTLEKNWNDKLTTLEEVKNEFSEYQQKKFLNIGREQKEELLTIAQDFPKLWKSPSTKSKDKKRILRRLIKDITIERQDKKVTLHIRWQSGAVEDIVVTIPLSIYEQTKYSEKMIELVRELAKEKTDKEIVNYLNKEGYVSGTKKPFTIAMVKWIRFKYKITFVKLKRPEELSVKEIAEKFGVSINVVYYWIEIGIISGCRSNFGSPYCITLSSEKKKELYEWVNNSTRIKKNLSTSQKLVEGGAV